jgi:hypothetical protein
MWFVRAVTSMNDDPREALTSVDCKLAAASQEYRTVLLLSLMKDINY